MALAQILYPPPTDKGMEEWFQAHARHHQGIIGALKDTKGIILEDLGLYPVSEHELDDWLRRHQQMHNDMTAAVGVAGSDLAGLDLKDKARSDSWFFQHFLQHQSVSQLCGWPI